MIYHSMIIRVQDGLPLSETTDGKFYKEVSQARNCIKKLFRKTKDLKERCTIVLETSTSVIHYIISVGVSYMVICEQSYPPLLAFSFLEDIKQEFTSYYKTSQVNATKRPYSFIEFDDYIVKIRQRYNNPKNISPRIQLSELSEDIRLNPPEILKIKDNVPINDFNFTKIEEKDEDLFSFCSNDSAKFFTVVILSGIFVFFSFYRGFIFMSGLHMRVEDNRFQFKKGLLFILEGLCHFMQAYSYFQVSTRQKQNGFITRAAPLMFFFIILVSNILLAEVKTWWHIASSLIIAFCILYCSLVKISERPTSKYNI